MPQAISIPPVFITGLAHGRDCDPWEPTHPRTAYHADKAFRYTNEDGESVAPWLCRRGQGCQTLPAAQALPPPHPCKPIHTAVVAGPQSPTFPQGPHPWTQKAAAAAAATAVPPRQPDPHPVHQRNNVTTARARAWMPHCLRADAGQPHAVRTHLLCHRHQPGRQQRLQQRLQQRRQQ